MYCQQSGEPSTPTARPIPYQTVARNMALIISTMFNAQFTLTPMILTARTDANGTLLRDLWPNRLGRCKTDASSIADLKPWQIMPTSFDSLSEWADVEVDEMVGKVLGPNGFRTPYALLRSISVDVEASNPRQRTLIRFQGFLSTFCIRPLGTWTG